MLRNIFNFKSLTKTYTAFEYNICIRISSWLSIIDDQSSGMELKYRRGPDYVSGLTIRNAPEILIIILVAVKGVSWMRNGH